VEKVKPLASTSRLRLRLREPSDEAPFATMNADPRMREHYPSVLTREESDAAAARGRMHFDRHGLGLWAVELGDVPGFIGYAGIMFPSFKAPCGPCVEIGWRLAFAHWGKGFATLGNVRSQRVMQKIGMSHDPADDFDHPLLPEGHRLRRYVLYRLRKADWAKHAAKT
jgi:RimJ/RimL family protein N-acetyltransferase